MNGKLTSTFLAVFILLLCPLFTYGQHFGKKNQYWSLGGNANIMNYVGDVTGDKNMFSIPLSFTRENIGVCAVKRLSPRTSARGNFSYGTIKGNDRISSSEFQGSDVGRWERGANFKNSIYELNSSVMVDFYENRRHFTKRSDINAYAFAGVGVIYHNPKMSVTNERRGNEWQKISSMPNLGHFSKIQGVFIYGLGFRYKLDKRWDLAVEIGWRKTTTDKLDGVWGTYEDTSNWTDEELALYDKTSVDTGIDKLNGKNWTSISTPGEIRGKSAYDGYIITGIHITRIMGEVVCPKFR